MEMREKWLNQLKERVLDVPLEIRALMGKKKMHIQEFMQIAEDNIIVVDRYVNDPIDIAIYEKTKFRGKMGIYKGNKAVKIEELAS